MPSKESKSLLTQPAAQVRAMIFREPGMPVINLAGTLTAYVSHPSGLIELSFRPTLENLNPQLTTPAALSGMAGGRSRSPRKQAAARKNGKHGGRPHKPGCVDCGSPKLRSNFDWARVECQVCGANESFNDYATRSKSHQPQQASPRLRVTPQAS